MKAFPISFVYESPRVPDPIGPPGPEWYLPLIEEIGRRTSQTVSVVYGRLRDVLPIEGFVLLEARPDATVAFSQCDPAHQNDLAGRLIPIGLVDDPTRMLSKALEPLSLAAAVHSSPIHEWHRGGHCQAGARGVFGLRDIGRIAGADCDEATASSARYCHLRSTRHFGVAHLLVDYLLALSYSRAYG